MKQMNGRFELKHTINYADVLELRNRLPLIMKPDEHAGQGGYRVTSLYFDNDSDKALREKIDGVDEREKFRLRCYNNDFSFIRLEKKSKRRGPCYKDSAVISEEACRRLMGGDISVLMETDSPLCAELYAKMRYQRLRPKNIVDYKREAFVYPMGNVRVTIDYDIRSGLSTHDFLTAQPAPIPMPGVYILEVKYDHFLPEVIRGVVSLSSRRSAAFSKYAAARIV